MCEHRRLPNGFRYAVHATGIDQGRASRNVHDTKAATGRGGADNVTFCLDCGAINAPETNEVIGNLFDEALRRQAQSVSKGTQMISTKASFRIMGKDLDPSEITKLLNMHPDRFHRCGDPNMSTSGRIFADYTEGLWAIDSSVDETHAMDAHLEALVTKLWQHRDLLQEFRKRGYKMDIFIGIFGIDDNTGCVLKNTLLMRVMQLGVDLDLDLYPS